jgi:lipopolysaccharide biosynthesis glycosyltransferase
MNVAFCCDQFALPGLYLSIYTLLECNPGEPLSLFLIHEGLSKRALKSLQRSVKEVRPSAELNIRTFSTRDLRFAKGFHGNYMVYARMFLADLLPEIDRVIYLDSDLLINRSIDEIWQIELNGCSIGGVSMGDLDKVAVERNFLLEIGLPKTAQYFNSGVLLIDLALWRSKQMTKACLDFLATHPSRCIGDQTVLNALFSLDFIRIPDQYNIMVPRDTASYADGLPPGVFHFAANPKPWDFLGRQFHSNWAIYDGARRRTGIPRGTRDFLPRVVRTFRIARSYVRLLLARLKKKQSG